MAEPLTKRQRYEREAAGLKLDRVSFEAQWRDIGNKLFPMRPRFVVTDRNRGERRNQEIIDSTATFAANTLSSGLHAGLTSPSRPWMRLTTPDPSLAKFPPVAAYLDDVRNRMMTVFQLSNLYKVLPTLYDDLGVFGTAAMAVLDDPGDAHQSGDLFRCYPYPIGSYWIAHDNRNLVTTFLRESAKTVAQLVTEFGGTHGQRLERGQDIEWSRFSLKVKNAWERGDYETVVDICWLVTPNYDYDPSRLDYRSFPWVSVHFEKGTAQEDQQDLVLREAGFHEFPLLVPTWKRSAEDIYGTECPGMTALGDVRQLQISQKRKGQAIEKLVNPPLQAPHSYRTQKVSALPGDTTYGEQGPNGNGGVRPIYEVKPDLQYMILDQQEVQRRIHQAFHVDVFRMISMMESGSSPVTAEEIRAREQEKLMQLGPIVEASNEELLDPLVDRVFAMMGRANLLPKAPPDLDGVELVVEYISILAQAQKLTKVAPLDGFLSRVGALMQTNPEVRHKIDSFEVVNEYKDAFGINPKLVRDDDDAQQSAQQEAQAAQQAQAAEQAAAVGKAAKDLGTTPMQGDTALNRLLEGAA